MDTDCPENQLNDELKYVIQKWQSKQGYYSLEMQKKIGHIQELRSIK